MVHRLSIVFLPSLLATLLLLAGCGANPHVRISEDPHQNLKNADPDVRIEALQVLVERNDAGAIPLVIDRLEDEEPGVRMFAYHALRKLSGESFGFTPYAAESVRAAEVARWRAWWAQKHGGEGPSSKPAPAPASEKKS